MKSAAEVNDDSEGRQLDLPVGGKDLPAAITFDTKTPDGLVTKYVRLSRATEWHLSEYEKKLNDGIRADSSNLRKVRQLHRTLKPIFDANPGITVERALPTTGQRGRRLMSHTPAPDPRRPGQPGAPTSLVGQPAPDASRTIDPERPARPDGAVFSAKAKLLGFCAHQLAGYSPDDIIDALIESAAEYKRAQRRVHHGSRRPNKSRASVVISEVNTHGQNSL